MSVLNLVVRLLKKEEERLDRELLGITAAISAFGKTYVNGRRTAIRSTADRVRISDRQRAHSANTRKTRKVVSIKSKRTTSAVAGKKAAASQRIRSAKVKAAKKSA
jgi:hypothetical protein